MLDLFKRLTLVWRVGSTPWFSHRQTSFLPSDIYWTVGIAQRFRWICLVGIFDVLVRFLHLINWFTTILTLLDRFTWFELRTWFKKRLLLGWNCIQCLLLFSWLRFLFLLYWLHCLLLCNWLFLFSCSHISISVVESFKIWTVLFVFDIGSDRLNIVWCRVLILWQKWLLRSVFLVLQYLREVSIPRFFSLVDCVWITGPNVRFLFKEFLCCPTLFTLPQLPTSNYARTLGCLFDISLFKFFNSLRLTLIRDRLLYYVY